MWDCHIILLYKKQEDRLILTALAIGSHSKLF
ncbi:hypothetical protein CNT09_09230 [Campylobacter coli]|nr:hypothetical protein [Campylobacter coli]EAK6386291.1 hypothetical protein [Campylobacter coli]EJE1652640.1 hypothetical protein [Campylobacter coli]HEH5010726.1 hypothetical protein [Campylobacter coli]HEH5040752.1 hypothetical protein [Campylobacter coli]